MEFSTVLLSNPKTVGEQARTVEDIGFTHLWFGEVPHVGGGDPYVAMALAALATRHLKLGTYIAAAPLRAAVSIVNSVATVNALAAGTRDPRPGECVVQPVAHGSPADEDQGLS